MKSLAVSERYAEALFELARDGNKVAQFGNRLNEVLDVLNKYPELSQIIYHPVVTKEDKKQVLHQIFEKELPTPLMNFLFLLVDKKREKLLPDIISQYSRLRNELNKTVVAQVVTAIPLYTDSKNLLQKELEDYLDQQVIMECYVDKAILGGVRIKIEDRLIDASLKSQLQALAQTLV